jgi:DNA-binding CsgD family transcriptional regulator
LQKLKTKKKYSEFKNPRKHNLNEALKQQLKGREKEILQTLYERKLYFKIQIQLKIVIGR